MTTLLLGHKGRCFDVRRYVYENKDFIYTASEDGTAKLWQLTATAPQLFSETVKNTENIESSSSSTSSTLSSSTSSLSESSSLPSSSTIAFEAR